MMVQIDQEVADERLRSEDDAPIAGTVLIPSSVRSFPHLQSQSDSHGAVHCCEDLIVERAEERAERNIPAPHVYAYLPGIEHM